MVHKQKMAALILAKMRPGGAKEEPEEDEGGDAMSAAAEHLIEAVHSRDVGGVVAALQHCFDIYGGGE